MKDIKFVKDTRKEEIVSALLSGQRVITIDHMEVFLTTLKVDTTYNKKIAAEKQADKIINAIDS